MSVRIEPCSLEKLSDIHFVSQDFLSSKSFCCLFPMKYLEPISQTRKNYTRTPDKLTVGGIAYETSTNAPLGVIQCACHGHYSELHTVKPGECYVDWLAVLPAARGKGVGTKLLQWAEERARERKCDRMTLGVINGNPAKRLYERFGFVTRYDGVVEAVCGVVFTLVCFGRPYGCLHGSCGSSMMEKKLDSVEIEAMERE
ncbi:hypothetical protein ScalyP_jg2000 [Parmales sp. scaly parma]|nr:hypothetical protein ScalyP_jg2000 [Parmales sp. scaly parma]